MRWTIGRAAASGRIGIVLVAALCAGLELSACDNRTQDAAASRDLKRSGSDLAAAAKDAGAALKREADAAKPELDHLGRQADVGAAKLADATGAAVRKAGADIDSASVRASAGARKAAERARERADGSDAN